jgi:hypothetical protein
VTPDADSNDDNVTTPDGLTAEQREELWALVRIGYYAVPVAMVHLYVIYAAVSAISGWRLPDSQYTAPIAGWLWVNGAVVTAAAWLWRRGSLATMSGEVLRGSRARMAILTWITASIVLFILPVATRIAWDDLRGLFGF